MKTQEVSTNIEVGGAILTKKAIDYIKDLQKNDNENLDACLESLSEVVCYIGKRIYLLDGNEEIKEAAMAISKLSLILDEIKDLKKP